MNLSFKQGNLELSKNPYPTRHGIKNSLYYHYITIIFKQLGNLKILINTKTKLEDTNNFVMDILWLRSSTICSEEYSAKIRKASRFGPAESNEATLRY